MIADPVDLGKIATNLTQRAIDNIIARSETLLKDYWARYKNRDATTYSEYLVRKGIHANAVRNFIYDTDSASLYDIYVPTRFSGGITGDDLIRNLCLPIYDHPKKPQPREDSTNSAEPSEERARPTPAYAIVGRAGAGKPMFMRHAFFHIQSINARRLPILIEARAFNRLPLDTITARVADDFAAMGTSVSREQISNALESGLFIILLDSFDELKGVIQSHYEAELANFVSKFPLCPILVASRPTRRMLSWALDIRTLAPLDLFSAEKLVALLELDEQVKAAFIELIHTRLFRTHHDFVSVPLLCTIMLLTFADTGRIANDRHEFFEDAFTALWSKHDSRKEGFERQRYSGLHKGEFLSLLTAVAISSYSSADYDMRPSLFHRHFEAGTRLSGVICKEEEFLQDLLISTSIWSRMALTFDFATGHFKNILQRYLSRKRMTLSLGSSSRSYLIGSKQTTYCPFCAH